MPIDDPVKKLVHDVLYREACKEGPKARTAELELVGRGDFARANMAVLIRMQRRTNRTMLQNLYWEKILDPAQIASVGWDSPA